MVEKLTSKTISMVNVPNREIAKKVNEVIESGGGTITVDPELDPTSTNPVENRLIYNKVSEIDGNIELINDDINSIELDVTNHGSAITSLQNSVVSLQNTKEDTFDVRSPVRKSGGMLTVDVTDTVELGNNLPVSSKAVNTTVLNAINALAELVAQDIASVSSTLQTLINNVDAKFNGCKIVGRWVGKLNVSSVVKYNGNLLVQLYGSSNPGLYLLSGFNVDYQKRAIIMQQYHLPEMVLIKPLETTLANQCQFTVNKPDGTLYSGDVRVDIIVLQILS